MSGVSASATRPAILIAHGSFGFSAAKRLLVGAALRGRLAWRAGSGGDGERRLRDVAVLWWPDSEDVGDGDGAASALELMRDLDRQIETLASEDDLADEVERAAMRLLSAAERLRRDDVLPLGLDVFLLARPRSFEAIGRLDRVLAPAVERLAAKKVLRRGTQGSERLSFVQILDFEDFWRPDAQSHRLRGALASSAARWRRRAQDKEPGFGRIYLIDGQTEDGVKLAKDRLDEVVLFLELLLFEGLRAGPLQRLYQRQRDDEAPIATFGVRVFERSSGLLRRLAAASFAVDWLEHLDTAEPTGDGEWALDLLLGPLAGKGLEEHLAFQDLEAEIDRSFTAFERELAEVTPERPGWGREIAQRHRVFCEELEHRLDAELTRLLAEKAPWLDGLPAALARAADEDLAAASEGGLPRQPHPRSARAVLDRLDTWRRRLAPARSAAPSPSGAGPRALRGLEELSERYLRFREGQVEAGGLRAFWPLWAAALACAGAPGLLELLSTVPAPDPTAPPFLLWAHRIFERSLGPVTVSLGLVLAGLMAGLLVAQPRLVQGARRGRRFFVDPARGRLADRLRRELAPGGGLRSPLEARLAAAAADREAGVRGRLVREIDHLRRRLRERRREIGWLRDQLAELLRVHGLGPVAPRRDGESLRQGSGVRRSAERVGDVRRLLSSNPPGPERFLSMQSTENPLAGWRGAEAGVLLRPLEFLDGLSRRFHDPGLLDAKASGDPSSSGEEPIQPDPPGAGDPSDLLDFLEHHRSFRLSFPWHGSDEVPVDESHCLLPRPLAVAEIRSSLREMGLAEDSWHAIDDPGRLYLLRVQLGVAPERLLGGGGS